MFNVLVKIKKWQTNWQFFLLFKFYYKYLKRKVVLIYQLRELYGMFDELSY